MKPDEKREFGELLTGLLELYGRHVTPSAAGLWWGAFERYPLAEVRAAFSRYTQDPEQGRYPPTPAAVLSQMRASGPARIGADEAWALCLRSFDEAETVVLTDEVLEARSVAYCVWADGDTVGARMAFRAAYERIAAARRCDGKVPTWQLSVGWDPEGRARAAQQALADGLLRHDQVAAHLPAPEPDGAAAAVAGLLTGNVVPIRDHTAETRSRLAELKASMTPRADDAERAAEDRVRFERTKRDAIARLQALAEQRTG